jgi:hypothetical protein
MKIDLTRTVPSFLFVASVALASFSPSIRIDHNDIPTNWMESPAITLGPQTSGVQPIYVAFQKDSILLKGLANTSSVMFQKSTDGGRTWLPQDVLVQRGAPLAEYPDITTDPEGNIYIVFIVEPDSAANNNCVTRSSDGGSTWSTPVNVHSASGLARIAADSGGNLFVTWAEGHVYLSISTDKGLTWSPRVRVDDDTVRSECYNADPYVQPGTNHYLVVASVPYHHSGGYIAQHAYLYRSTNMGQTFESGLQLDSLGAGVPHVVADAQHIVCNYICKSELPDQKVTESRTCYAPADTWGSRVLVTELDTPYITYVQGSTMAISGDGRVHTALMLGNGNIAHYLAYYVCSSDHGASWSERELVSDDTTSEAWREDVGADSSGHAYVVWQQFRYEGDNRGQIWFATNNPLAVAEEPVRQSINAQLSATVVRNVLFLPKMGTVPSGTVPIFGPSLLDASGRKVMDLRPGANDVRVLAPGVYFVREAQAQAIRKVVVTR